MKLTTSDIESVAALALSEGWRVLVGFINESLTSNTRRLTDEHFADLAEVCRLQGEITALRKVLSFVNNRTGETKGV